MHRQLCVSLGPGSVGVSAPCSSFSPTLRTLHSLPFRTGNLCSLRRSASLSESLSVCFASTAPRGSIGLAGQTLGSGPCSPARLADSCPGSRLQVWPPQVWSEPRLHGGAGPQQVRVCSQNPSLPALPSDARHCAPSGSTTGRQEQRLAHLNTAPRMLCTRASKGPRWQPHSSRQAVSLVL